MSVADRNRSTNVADGNFGMPLVMRQQSEPLNSVGVIGIDEQDLMVALLGIREVSSAMRANRRIEHSGDLGTGLTWHGSGNILFMSCSTTALLSIHGCRVLLVSFVSGSATAIVKSR